MLILLLAACKQAEVALQAAANALDVTLLDDLGVMIERTERELVALNAKIDASLNQRIHGQLRVVGAEPTEEELRAFINAMLSNLDKRLREPEVIDEAIRAHRDMWVMLYRAADGPYNDGSDEPSATPQ